jgi:hypothetical protein
VQDGRIPAIEQRLSAASGQRTHFSFEALRNELSIETELAVARADRGALLYDRDFIKNQQLPD